jgi:hypothetical protein
MQPWLASTFIKTGSFASDSVISFFEEFNHVTLFISQVSNASHTGSVKHWEINVFETQDFGETVLVWYNSVREQVPPPQVWFVQEEQEHEEQVVEITHFDSTAHPAGLQVLALANLEHEQFESPHFWSVQEEHVQVIGTQVPAEQV